MSDYTRLLDLLKTLVSFKTVTHDRQAAKACLDFIERSIAGYNLVVNRYLSNGFESLVISTRDTKHPPVLLQAHLDVVPAHPEQFNLGQREGKLYGRGVYDMKFAAACYLHLLQELRDDIATYDFSVMFTTDEEDGGNDGVEYLLNQGYMADVCVLPDSGENWNIEASAKGFAIAEITVNGKSAHGSRPWEADNAASTLAGLIRDIESEFASPAPLEETATLTLIKAGEAYNQIPDTAYAAFDLRYRSEETYAVLKKRIRQLATNYNATVQFTAHAAAVQHNTESTAFETWQDITTKVTGQAPGFVHSFAASDARYTVPRGIATISARPRGGGHHGGEEWISETDFYRYYEVIKQFVAATARQPMSPPIDR